MIEKKLYQLNINPYYRDLIPPLSKDEYSLLEESILENGCEHAITVWDDTIIDGHHRYSICCKHNIPFHIKNMYFQMEEEAVSWICNNQLGRRNINLETKKYLIGKRYDAEKVIGATNKHGFNQYKSNKVVGPKKLNQPKSSGNKTSIMLAAEYRLSHATICKYNVYAHCIDKIASINSTVSDCILSADLKVSHNNLVELSKLPSSDLAIIGDFLAANVSKVSYFNYIDVLDVLKKKKMKTKKETVIIKRENTSSPIEDVAGIKKIPKYDPDSEITSLTLTIPSWSSSISRTINNSNLTEVSINAKNRLKKVLFDLDASVINMLKIIEEGDE